MIFVPTFATEVYGVKALVRVAGEKLLTLHRHLACAGRLDRHVGVAGTRDELVELERVEVALACPRVRGPYPLGDARHEKKLSQHLRAGSLRSTGFRRQPAHRVGHRHRLRPDPALVDLGERDTKPRLHPNRERVLPKCRVGDVRRYAGIDGHAKVGPDRIGGGRRIGDALERLGDDVAVSDGDPEQLRGHACDHPVLVLQRSFARHGGRGADAQELLRLQALADTAHQQRHVCTLAAAVRVELVQDEEAKARAVSDDPPVEFFLPRNEELKHHEIGKEDVRRIVCHPPPLVSVFLPRVAGERDRPVSSLLTDELAQLLHLGVRKRVHRVDDNRLRAPLRVRPPCGQHMADDGDEETERLPGPRAGRHHEALPLCGERDGLLLVLVERQRLTARTEDVGTAGV